MGCSNSKATENKPADGLQFNAANLDDVDQSTHRKKKAAAVPTTAVTTPPVPDAVQNNPVAEASVVVEPVSVPVPVPEEVVTQPPAAEVAAQ